MIQISQKQSALFSKNIKFQLLYKIETIPKLKKAKMFLFISMAVQLYVILELYMYNTDHQNFYHLKDHR